jgi:Tol biopolymer transport system component
MFRHRLTELIATLAIAAAATTAAPAAASPPPRSTYPDDRGVIVWTVRLPGGSEHLVRADADGRHQRDLTSARPGIQNFGAQISPNGRWIVYTENTPGPEYIRLMRSDGSDNHIIVGCADNSCNGPVDSPTWLSNNRIIYSQYGPIDNTTGVPAWKALYTARIDGTHIRRFSDPSIDGVYEDSQAHLSRDHRYVTFQRADKGGDNAALFRVGLDGHSDLRQLTPKLNMVASDLSTARRGPAKDLIVFDSPGRGNPDASFVDIATVPATCTSLADCTSKIHWITDNNATGRRTAKPQWSPDGSSLVFTERSSVTDQNPDIWTMRYPRSARRQISTSPYFDVDPAWGSAHCRHAH